MSARDAILTAVRNNLPRPAVPLPETPGSERKGVRHGLGYKEHFTRLPEVPGVPDLNEPLLPYFRRQLEAMGGRSFEVTDAEAASVFAEDFSDERLANRLTPVIDSYVVSRYKDLAARVREYGLVRKDVDVDSWFEPKYLDAALKAQHLEHFWPRFDGDGKKVDDGEVEKTQVGSR